MASTTPGRMALAVWLVAAAGMVLRVVRRRRNVITCAATAFNSAVLGRCPQLMTYRPTPWLPGADANTLFAGMFRSSPHLTYSRVLLPMPDGGAVAVDWHTLPRPGQGVLILLHGLTGGSEERYIQWMIKAASEARGLRLACVVMNARGCSTSTLLTPQSFSAAWTVDIRCTVQYVRAVVGEEVPVFAVGYSLGAGILTKYICEDGPSCRLTAAVACCASFDHHQSTALLESGRNLHTYNAYLTSCLKRFFLRHQHQFATADWLDLDAVAAATTIRQFDAATMVPMFGYADVSAFYDDASTAKLLHRVRIPMLLLNAEDDPVCATAGVPLATVQANPHLISVVTPEGGHVAWCQGWWPVRESWENAAVVQYLAAILAVTRGPGWNPSTVTTASTPAGDRCVAGAGEAAVLGGVPDFRGAPLPVLPMVVGWKPAVPATTPSPTSGAGWAMPARVQTRTIPVDADTEAALEALGDGMGGTASPPAMPIHPPPSPHHSVHAPHAHLLHTATGWR